MANPDAVSASLENGVLRLEIAKAAQPQPRKIAVQAAQPAAEVETTPVSEGEGVTEDK